jgi:hypothetical protein
MLDQSLFRSGRIPGRAAAFATALVAGAAACVPSAAQEPGAAGMVDADPVVLGTIENRLNEAGICTPLTFDLRVVSALVGVPVPSFIPIDTNLRWDQSQHRMIRFASTPEAVRLDFELGCQPSSNGAVLEFIGVKPETLRMADAVACTGVRAGDGSLATLVCRADGRVGRFLSTTVIGLSEKVGRLLPMHLAVPVSEVVAPFGPTRPSSEQASPSSEAGDPPSADTPVKEAPVEEAPAADPDAAAPAGDAGAAAPR